MNHYISIAEDFITSHRKKIVTGIWIALSVVVIATTALLFLYNMPKDVYSAVKACDLFTPAEAQDLLGDKVISIDTPEPVITDDTATSKCSYTDSNPAKGSLKLIAIAVRSGLNTKGVELNKTDFTANKPSENTELVKNLGDSAYFNKELGQLNILDGRQWIKLSYGVGGTPQNNTLDDAVKFAKKVLN